MIKINHLNYEYKNKVIFNDINLLINKGEFLFIIGPSGSGKTTLIKILSGLIEGNFDIKINNLDLNNITEIRKNMSVILENPNNIFLAETVYDELAFRLENLGINKKEIDIEVKRISKDLKIDNLLEMTPNNLSGGEKELVAIASGLVGNPEIVILDECMSMIDGITKEYIFKYLKKLNRTNKTTIICTTQEMNDILYGKRVVILNDKKIILDSKLKKSFNEKIFKQASLELPFMVSLSNKLSYYGLVDETITDMNKMVNKLWK